MKVKVECRHCHKTYELEMTPKQYDRLVHGQELVTRIFPEWTPGQRELLISQTCESCWEEIFKDYDE